MSGKYTVMLLTCDKNEDLWPMFFFFFKKYWHNFNEKIFINTESKKFQYDNLKIQNSSENFHSNTPWSFRFYQCLKQIDDEYVLLIMDDFFFTDYVDYKEIECCIDRMNEDKSIACFNFSVTRGPAVSFDYERYELKDRKSPFRMNLQAGIWRKDKLLKYIRKHENPWQFETWGSIRVRRYNDKIYHMRKNSPKVFSYHVGGVIADGKWRTSESVDYIENNGFDVDFNIRGIYNDGDSRKTEIVHRNFLTKVWQVFTSLL